MLTPDQLVRNEVRLCLSSLVSTLAENAGSISARSALSELADQAVELCAPVDDYEEAATQEGWSGPGDIMPDGQRYYTNKDGRTWDAKDWQELCEAFDIEPYEWDIYEHWAVSHWLGDKLREHGERVDNDFAGHVVWGRTTTGQGIACDGVIEKICAELAMA